MCLKPFVSLEICWILMNQWTLRTCKWQLTNHFNIFCRCNPSHETFNSHVSCCSADETFAALWSTRRHWSALVQYTSIVQHSIRFPTAVKLYNRNFSHESCYFASTSPLDKPRLATTALLKACWACSPNARQQRPRLLCSLWDDEKRCGNHQENERGCCVNAHRPSPAQLSCHGMRWLVGFTTWKKPTMHCKEEGKAERPESPL